MQDMISALAVPPGNSLTDAPGKWPWEKPARFPDPNDAIDFITDDIANGPTQNDMLRLMMAGITVEELVEQISFKGFMAGANSPDGAELIKPAIGIFLYGLAIENGFEPQMLIDESPPEGAVSDATFFETAKLRNPELYAAMTEEMNRQTRMGTDDIRVEEKPADLSKSFIAVVPERPEETQS